MALRVYVRADALRDAGPLSLIAFAPPSWSRKKTIPMIWRNANFSPLSLLSHRGERNRPVPTPSVNPQVGRRMEDAYRPRDGPTSGADISLFPLGSMKTARRSYRKDPVWNQLRNFFAKRGNPFPIHRYRESVRADTKTFLARLPFCRNGPWGLLLTREAAFFPFLPCFSFRLSSLFLPFFLSLFIFFLLSVFPLFLYLALKA